ncbi:hypothetical protein [Sansalvadorimonas verongulae]|uniref:hypothetical protein n=1 Tax=Sansalvadorimonas verongulae TaxID=2172824 RepID=UPI0012BBA2E4|nr:hypothetical protein [Sansalvadorimonas verongulae]MTI13014.1 hypothetical protein [Sansalvadorimonas verongulae]
MAGERITQAEFARRNGWSKQYVAKLVKQGRIQLEGGKIDPVAARQAIAQLAEPSTVLRERAQEISAPSRPATSVPSNNPTDSRKAVDYAAARTMREAFRAKMARLDYEEREGKLVDAKKVREDAFQQARMIRDGFLGIPDRMADVLAAETNPSKVRQILMDELETVLEKLSD